MLIQAFVFLAYFYLNDCMLLVRYGELVTVQLRGNARGNEPNSKELLLRLSEPLSRKHASVRMSVVSEIEKAGRDRKVRDVTIERRNQFIKKIHIKCTRTRLICGHNSWDSPYFNSADDDEYAELKKNYWAKDSRTCGRGGWCIRCNSTHCPPYYNSMDCSDDGLGKKCRDLSYMYKCNSIPELMNPECELKGCVGNNRKTSVIRLYREPTCQLHRINFEMQMILFEQRVTKERDHIMNITFTGAGDDPIFRIQIHVRDCEPSAGCTLILSSQALSAGSIPQTTATDNCGFDCQRITDQNGFKPDPNYPFDKTVDSSSRSESGIYQPQDDGNWELLGDFYYKRIETVNNGQVARMNYSDAVNTCWDHGGDLPILEGQAESTAYVDGIEFYNYCKQHNYDCWLGLNPRRSDNSPVWLWRDDFEDFKPDNFPRQHLSLDDRLAGVIVDLENAASPEGLKMRSVSQNSLHAVVCQRHKNATDLDFDDNCPSAVKIYRSWIHNEVQTESCRQVLLTYFGQRLIHSFLRETNAGAEKIDIQRYRSVSCNDTAAIMWLRNYEVWYQAPECQAEVERYIPRNMNE